MQTASVDHAVIDTERADRSVVKAVQAISAGEPVARFQAGRQCRQHGCSTRLSVYNASDRCFLHTPRHRYILRPPRRRKGDPRPLS